MRSNGRASKVPRQHSLPRATPRNQRLCGLWLGSPQPHGLKLVVDFCLPASRRVDATSLPGEAVAPFGERLHRSLPHTRLGVWFVLRTASQATSCLPTLDVVALHARARPLRVLTRSLPLGSPCRVYLWQIYPNRSRRSVLPITCAFKNQQLPFSGHHGIKSAVP
jgi:hypothetical protein